MPKRKTSDKQFLDFCKEINLEQFRESIKSNFSDFPDPRLSNKCVYPVWYLCFITLSAYLAGGNTIADIAHFAELRSKWINSLIGEQFTIPSYDTFWWFLARVKPEAFKNLLSRWLIGLPKDLRDQLLVVDGKRLCGTSTSEHINHVVELFAANQRLVIAQEKVPDKACERQALKVLLSQIDIQGAIVSMDAHYTYLSEINEILGCGADYIVGIKGNQGNLEAEVQNYFEQAYDISYEGVLVSRFETHEKDHGRIESRVICVTNDLDWLPQRAEWHLESLIEIRSERKIGDKIEKSIRYYGSSRKAQSKSFAQWIRGHWSIENSLHYVADVVFNEDASLADMGNTAENLSLIRRLAMNIIKSLDPDRGMVDARRTATYEPDYLRGVLGKLFVKSF